MAGAKRGGKGGIAIAVSKPTKARTSDAAARRTRGEMRRGRSRLCIGDDEKSHVAIREIVHRIFFSPINLVAKRACRATIASSAAAERSPPSIHLLPGLPEHSYIERQ